MTAISRKWPQRFPLRVLLGFIQMTVQKTRKWNMRKNWYQYMLGCAVVLCLAAFAGCTQAGKSLQGFSATSYVSSVRPALSIQAVNMPLKVRAQGFGTLYRPSMTGVSVSVYSAVYATSPKEPVAIVTHAKLPTHKRWIWSTVYPRPASVHEATEQVGPLAMTAFTYLVPCITDPFAGVAGEETAEGQQSYWIARHFAAPANFRYDKISLEYREPAPKEMTSLSSGIPYGMTEWLAGFEERARKAFAITEPQGSASDLAGADMGSVRWRYMNDAWLGDVMERYDRDRRF